MSLLSVLFLPLESTILTISQSPGSSHANVRLEGQEIWQHTFKGTLQSFFSRKATLNRGLHGDSFGCILHAVSMSMSTSAHRKTHACRGAQ
jgi:hypothetical protein